MVEWLERFAVVRKVASSNPARAKRLEICHCPPSSKWVPITSGKVKGGERRGLGPAFHMSCPRHDGVPLPRRSLGYGHLTEYFNVYIQLDTFYLSETIDIKLGRFSQLNAYAWECLYSLEY